MNNPEIVFVIIPARNEEKSILKTLNALEGQTIPPKKVIVVDDGSRDNTLQLLREYSPKKFQLIIRSRPHRIHGKSLVGTPGIAKTFNIGFKVAAESYYDFILIIGADTLLEKMYIEKILEKFSNDKSLAIASGRNILMRVNPMHARGSGRMIAFRFWKYYGERYPVIYGWEDDCLNQCRRVGLKVKNFPEIHFTLSRKDQSAIDFINWGYAARAMRYHPIIAIMRSLRFLILQKYGLKATIRFLAGYFSIPLAESLTDDQFKNRKFMRRHQIKQIPKKIFSIIKIIS